MVGLLSPAELDELADQLLANGWTRLSGVCSADEARAMRTRLWVALAERHGVHQEDRATWRLAQPTGLQDLREDAVFRPLGGSRLRAALDGLLGAERWRRPRHWGQFLATFPGEGWQLPTEIWHTDYDFAEGAAHAPGNDRAQRPFPWSGLQVFSCLSDAPARSGATLAVEGSHRVVADYVAGLSETERAPMRRVRTGLLDSDPWLRELAGRGSSASEGDARVERFLGTDGEVFGRRVRVVELTGCAGDALLAHPWLLHASAANATREPRFACVQRVRCVAPGRRDSS